MSDVVVVELDSAAVAYRPAAGEKRCVPAAEAAPTMLFQAAPWRTFRWYFGQRHYSGTYWSAAECDHVVYESRLELANLLLAETSIPRCITLCSTVLIARSGGWSDPQAYPGLPMGPR